jgi:hypothetical protein
MAAGANMDYIRAREILGDKLEEVCAPFLKRPNTDRTRADMIQAIEDAAVIELARKGAAELAPSNPTPEMAASDGMAGFMIVQFGNVDLRDIETSACRQLEIKSMRGMFGAIYETDDDALRVVLEMKRRMPSLVLEVRKNTVGMESA